MRLEYVRRVVPPHLLSRGPRRRDLALLLVPGEDEYGLAGPLRVLVVLVLLLRGGSTARVLHHLLVVAHVPDALEDFNGNLERGGGKLFGSVQNSQDCQVSLAKISINIYPIKLLAYFSI